MKSSSVTPVSTEQATADRDVDAAASAVAYGDRSRLPRVLPNVPPAVLLLDVPSGQVVHANGPARELTGALPLPAGTGAWTRGARLRTSAGSAYAEGASPVERAGAGEPVVGEAVRLASGQGAAHRWATAFPLPQGDRTLLVLFEVDGLSGDDAHMRDRAVLAAGLSFTISDPRQPDNPLVYVNPAFERTTGYSWQDAVGRNCRFMQGPGTDPADVLRVRALLDDREHGVVTLLNQRKDGTTFWNELSLSPVYDRAGGLTHVVGIQADVTRRVLIEQERERNLAAEQAARTVAERSQRRLALLAEATSMLAATLDVQESLNRLVELVVPLMADFCIVDLLVDSDGGMRRLATRHADPALEPLLQLVAERQITLGEGSLTRRVLDGGPPVLLEKVPPEHLAVAVPDLELRDAYRRLVTGSAIVVPLKARRQVLGALSLFTSDSGRTYDEDDLSMAADLGRRAALTVDNARLYQREHDVAEALQRSLLPTLPEVAGLDRAARYLPSRTAGQVGGDWYDLLPLPDGTIGVAIGDVMGHDLTAAAAMGQLRSVLRSYAWQGGGPAEVLDHLDELVQGLGMAQLATSVYGRLHLPSESGPGMLRYSNAGHLPPALRCPDGSVRFLTGGRSLLVGAALGTPRIEAQEIIEAGSVLVLYTDGLVEDRDGDIDDGLAALAAALIAADGTDAESIADVLTDALTTGEGSDDIAILVVKVL